jgi:hypothetical protein
MEESKYPIIFDIATVSEKDMKIVESIPDRLKLFEKHLEIQWKIKAIEPDEKTGIETESYYRGDRMILKSSVIGVEAIHANEAQTYKCIIRCNNEQGSYAFAYELLKDAVRLKEQIQNWLLQ